MKKLLQPPNNVPKSCNFSYARAHLLRRRCIAKGCSGSLLLGGQGRQFFATALLVEGEGFKKPFPLRWGLIRPSQLSRVRQDYRGRYNGATVGAVGEGIVAQEGGHEDSRSCREVRPFLQRRVCTFQAELHSITSVRNKHCTNPPRAPSAGSRNLPVANSQSPAGYSQRSSCELSYMMYLCRFCTPDSRERLFFSKPASSLDTHRELCCSISRPCTVYHTL
ncbi:hypothetical protein FN846DRAFT_633543 [Sphaerosporella brunnea]|uniref:Uncharacterized protein n=1 Tax=Sphaerosporella brunnea TaxID=1250544 RepID=A0A5J5F0X1_9PEZI|nr:hypothetical protein FN846DRAFT_633543 [Sphaerosporella brunnea]